MITKTRKQWAFVSVSVKIFTVAAVILGLLACSHHPPKEDCCSTRGKQFEDEWKVKAIYQTDNEQDAPANVNGTFKIERSKDSSIFRLVPDESFSNINDKWEELDLQYKPGSDANQRVVLVAEICANNQNSSDIETDEPNTEEHYDKKQKSMKPNQEIIEAVVHHDFINLLDRDLESLETGEQQRLMNKYKITIFHFKNKETGNVDLLIFYCGDEECKSSGMIHSEPK